MYQQEYYVFLRSNPGKTWTSWQTPGEALELFQKLSLGGGPVVDDIVIAQRVNPALLFAQLYTPRAIHVDKPEVREAKEVPDCRVAKPGQYVPHVALWSAGVHPVQSRGSADCAIVACANILGITYERAKVECAQHGWSSTKGLPNGFLELLLEQKKLIPLFRPDLSGVNVRSLMGAVPRGVYTVHVAGHIMAMANGQLLNLAGSEWQDTSEVYEMQPRSVVEAAEA